MLNFFFYKCGMRHEEFNFSSDSNDEFSLWKRNSLCSVEIRSKNVFCTHGTAILSLNKKLESTNPRLRKQLSDLQNRLFSMDHQKGELEKYVLEKDVEIRSSMLEKLETLKLDYNKICDEIEVLLGKENLQNALIDSTSFSKP